MWHGRGGAGRRSHWLFRRRTALPLAEALAGAGPPGALPLPQKRLVAGDGPASDLRETAVPWAHNPLAVASHGHPVAPPSGPRTTELAQAQSARLAAPGSPRGRRPRPSRRWGAPAAPPSPEAAEEAEGDDVIEQGDGHWAPF